MTLREHISPSKEDKIRKWLPIWRRDTNKKNPPGQQAAEAVSLCTLEELAWRAQTAKLTRGERQALDIFFAAFESMSRVGEIACLQVEDVARDGRTVAVRPKTGAKTWRKLTKRLSSTGGFNAARRLAHYRESARRQGRQNLFVGKGGKPPETASITSHLKRLSRKLGCKARITSHSARKGAAVEALKAGVPLPIIQALGAWKDAGSMQAYIGEAVRKSVSLMDILGRGGRKWFEARGLIKREKEEHGRNKGARTGTRNKGRRQKETTRTKKREKKRREKEMTRKGQATTTAEQEEGVARTRDQPELDIWQAGDGRIIAALQDHQNRNRFDKMDQEGPETVPKEERKRADVALPRLAGRGGSGDISI